MEIPDLEVIPPNHPPSPYDSPIMIGSRGREAIFGTLPDGLTLYAVGWIENKVPVTGEVPDECIDRLVDAHESDKTISDGTMGWHDCEVYTNRKQRCTDGRPGFVIQWRDGELHLLGHGHHLVRLGSAVYMCPVLILHYILEHGYQPPVEFLKAVIEGTFLTAEDLIACPETMAEWIEARNREA
jgi:hypothetical protein